MFGDHLRLEGAPPVTRGLERELPHITADRLAGMSVATIFGRRFGIVGNSGGFDGTGRQRRGWPASEMNIHLGVEHPFEGRLHHRPHQGVEVVNRRGLRGHVPRQLLGLGFQDRVHA